MKITKFEHACFAVDHENQSLIIDPGSLTTNLVVPDNVVGVVITHEHTDHRDIAQLERIIAANPNAIIVGHSDTIGDLDATFTLQPVQATNTIQLGSFTLSFYGGDHAIIDSSLTPITNLGVMINKLIYYPGDSFSPPNSPVDTLALPISAPWLKISEVANFARQVSPRIAFPTHDAITSRAGKQLYDRLVPQLLKDTDIKYQRLVEPLDI